MGADVKVIQALLNTLFLYAESLTRYTKRRLNSFNVQGNDLLRRPLFDRPAGLVIALALYLLHRALALKEVWVARWDPRPATPVRNAARIEHLGSYPIVNSQHS